MHTLYKTTLFHWFCSGYQLWAPQHALKEAVNGHFLLTVPMLLDFWFFPLSGHMFSRLKHSRAFSCSLCANYFVPLTLLAAFLWTSSSFHYIFFKMWGWKNNLDHTKCSWCKPVMALYSGKCCWVTFWLSHTNLNGSADRWTKKLWCGWTVWERAKCSWTV